jgi:hypothetical protein
VHGRPSVCKDYACLLLGFTTLVDATGTIGLSDASSEEAQVRHLSAPAAAGLRCPRRCRRAVLTKTIRLGARRLFLLMCSPGSAGHPPTSPHLGVSRGMALPSAVLGDINLVGGDLARLRSAGRNFIFDQILQIILGKKIEVLSHFFRPRGGPIYPVLGVPHTRVTQQCARLRFLHQIRAIKARRELV